MNDDGKLMAITLITGNGVVQVRSVEKGTVLSNYEAPADSWRIDKVQFMPDNKYILIWKKDDMAQDINDKYVIWDWKNHTVKYEKEIPSNGQKDQKSIFIQLPADEKYLIIASESFILRAYNLETGHLEKNYRIISSEDAKKYKVIPMHVIPSAGVLHP